MSVSISPSTGRAYGMKRVCDVWEFPRSSVYHERKRRKTEPARNKRGPAPKITDQDLLDMIRLVIGTSKFTGEGHRKVCARLKRMHGIYVGRNRVLRLMREAQLLSPHRVRQGKAKTHSNRCTQ